MDEPQKVNTPSSTSPIPLANTKQAAEVIKEGLKIDLEMKALIVLTIYSILKLLNADETDRYIEKQFDRSTDDKTTARKSCQLLFRNLIIKSLVVIAIHYKTKLLQPLFISVIMGFFTMIENGEFYDLLYTKHSKFFVKVFF
eukprot:gene12575-16863_t